jgi:hypothetical protein
VLKSISIVPVVWFDDEDELPDGPKPAEFQPLPGFEAETANWL